MEDFKSQPKPLLNKNSTLWRVDHSPLAQDKKYYPLLLGKFKLSVMFNSFTWNMEDLVIEKFTADQELNFDDECNGHNTIHNGHIDCGCEIKHKTYWMLCSTSWDTRQREGRVLNHLSSYLPQMICRYKDEESPACQKSFNICHLPPFKSRRPTKKTCFSFLLKVKWSRCFLLNFFSIETYLTNFQQNITVSCC